MTSPRPSPPPGRPHFVHNQGAQPAPTPPRAKPPQAQSHVKDAQVEADPKQSNFSDVDDDGLLTGDIKTPPPLPNEGKDAKRT